MKASIGAMVVLMGLACSLARADGFPAGDPTKIVNAAVTPAESCQTTTTGQAPKPQAPTSLYKVDVAMADGDALCFLNDEFDSGPYPLDKIATKYGACQGMVSLVQAFKSRARFHCDGKPRNDAQTTTIIDRVIDSFQGGCDDVIDVYGACDLKSLCQSHPKSFKRFAVMQNADLAISQVLGHLLELKRGATREAQSNNAQEISQIYSALEEGRPVMMLYPYHVVLVKGMEIVRDGDSWKTVLKIYDPNYSELSTYELKMTPDLHSTVGEPPIFALETEPSGEYPSCRNHERASFSPF